MAIEDDIKSAEDTIKKTPSNNATSHHIGRLKAKIARFRDEVQKRAAGSRLQNLSHRSQRTHGSDDMSKLDEKYETDMGKNEIKARMDILKTAFASIIGVLLIIVWNIFKESPDGLLRFSGNVLLSILICVMALWSVRGFIISYARQLDKKEEEEHSSLKSK